MNCYIIYGIVVVFVILLIFLVFIYTRDLIYNDILKGYWKSDVNFLEKNDIAFFTMAIGKCNNSKRVIYIIMTDENKNVIINEENVMTLVNQSWNPFSQRKKYNISFEHDIGIDKDGDLDEVIIPRKLNMIFEPVAGFLTLYDGNTVYAEMYKDNELSVLET